MGLPRALSGSWGPHFPGTPWVPSQLPCPEGSAVQPKQQGREGCVGARASPEPEPLLSHGSMEEEPLCAPAPAH